MWCCFLQGVNSAEQRVGLKSESDVPHDIHRLFSLDMSGLDSCSLSEVEDFVGCRGISGLTIVVLHILLLLGQLQVLFYMETGMHS